jgi:nucleotide-binding universal stress UspA family protein
MIDVKIEHILVPFDFTENTVNAFKTAERLAMCTGATLSLIHAVSPVFIAARDCMLACAMPLGYLEDYISSLETVMMEFCEENAERLNIVSSFKVEIGYWNNVLVEHARSADILIVGQDHPRDWDLTGSSISPLTLIKHIKIPLITVTGYSSPSSYKNIVLPIRNVTNWFDKVPFVLSLAKQTGAALHVLGLSEQSTKLSIDAISNNVDYTTAILKKSNVAYTVDSCTSQSMVESLREFSIRKNADIVAITPETGFKLSHLISHGFFERFLSVSPAPVMAVSFG